MPLSINTITNPHTNGRGQAVLLHPGDTHQITVRYDEYDECPAFFATLESKATKLANIDELDEGTALRFTSMEGEFTILLPMTLTAFANQLHACWDELEQR